MNHQFHFRWSVRGVTYPPACETEEEPPRDLKEHRERMRRYRSEDQERYRRHTREAVRRHRARKKANGAQAH